MTDLSNIEIWIECPNCHEQHRIIPKIGKELWKFIIRERAEK